MNPLEYPRQANRSTHFPESKVFNSSILYNLIPLYTMTVRCVHCCFTTSGLSLETPCTFTDSLPVELDQVAHSDRTNNGVEKNGPHSSYEAFLTHVGCLIISNLDNQESDFSSCNHRRAKKEPRE